MAPQQRHVLPYGNGGIFPASAAKILQLLRCCLQGSRFSPRFQGLRIQENPGSPAADGYNIGTGRHRPRRQYRFAAQLINHARLSCREMAAKSKRQLIGSCFCLQICDNLHCSRVAPLFQKPPKPKVRQLFQDLILHISPICSHINSHLCCPQYLSLHKTRIITFYHQIATIQIRTIYKIPYNPLRISPFR
ncbi:hypothetical protein D3C76_723630 [compost metagenome]